MLIRFGVFAIRVVRSLIAGECSPCAAAIIDNQIYSVLTVGKQGLKPRLKTPKVLVLILTLYPVMSFYRTLTV